MRLSGSYLDRLSLVIIPWTAAASCLFYIIDHNLKDVIITFLLTSIAFWILDTAIIYIKYKKPKPLLFDKNLKWGNRTISAGEILSIRPIFDKRSRWSFNMIEFLLIDDTTFYIIDKPNSIINDLFGKSSKTLKYLIIYLPELAPFVKQGKSV